MNEDVAGLVESLEAWGPLVASGYEVPAASKAIHEAASTIRAQAAEIERLRLACTKMNDEVSQTLGKALGYPWFKDDKENFPDATEKDGVCVGDHVAESLASEAAAKLREAVEVIRAARRHNDNPRFYNSAIEDVTAVFLATMEQEDSTSE
jgi:hypothetical protein